MRLTFPHPLLVWSGHVERTMHLSDGFWKQRWELPLGGSYRRGGLWRARAEKESTMAAWSMILGMHDDEIDSLFEGLDEDGALLGSSEWHSPCVPSARLHADVVDDHSSPTTSAPPQMESLSIPLSQLLRNVLQLSIVRMARSALFVRTHRDSKNGTFCLYKQQYAGSRCVCCFFCVSFSTAVALLPPLLTCAYRLLLFLTFSALVANPKKLWYFTRWPIPLVVCWKGEKKKKKKKSGSDPPSPRALLVRRKKEKKNSRDASTYLGATQVGYSILQQICRHLVGGMLDVIRYTARAHY